MRRDGTHLMIILLFVDLQSLYATGGDRVPGIGEAVGEHADLLALAHQRLVDLLGDDGHRQQLIAGVICLAMTMMSGSISKCSSRTCCPIGRSRK